MGVQRTVVSGLLLAFLLFLLAAPLSASTIGLYSDDNGSSCSFAGNQSGILSAYVIVKPDNLGIRGVRFSAPVPACLGATWIADNSPSGTLRIGDSQTGVSVAWASGTCSSDPMYALQIQYFRSNTTPCCAYTISPDPFVGIIEGTVCNYDATTLVPVESHFNANSSCPCGVPQAPQPPQDPVPPDGATTVSVTPNLKWTSLDTDVVSFDVFFGTSASPPFVANVISNNYPTPQLVVNTKYYWRVVTRDIEGFQVSGPVWSFTTRPDNLPPNAPTNPNPQNFASNVATNATISWVASDPDFDQLRFDIYFGTVNPPPLATSSYGANFYFPVLQANTWHYWRIVARDPKGAETSGPTWSFFTGFNPPPGGNHAPDAPSNPVPADNGFVTNTIAATLQWQCSDQDGDALSYIIYMGQTNPPLLYATSDTQFLNITNFPDGVTYWRVVAYDGQLSTSGPIWKFTKYNPTPVAFSSFDARIADDGARITWELHSDEAMESYTIYRAMTGAAASMIAVGTGPVSSNTGSFVDRSAQAEQSYVYSMMVRTKSGDEYRSPNATVVMPALELALGPNHPNPFNPQTTIPYIVPSGSRVPVRLVIYDAAGRTVRVLVNEEQAGGKREVVWRGDDETGATVSSGIYFCVLQAGNERRTQKLVLLK